MTTISMTAGTTMGRNTRLRASWLTVFCLFVAERPGSPAAEDHLTDGRKRMRLPTLFGFGGVLQGGESPDRKDAPEAEPAPELPKRDAPAAVDAGEP